MKKLLLLMCTAIVAMTSCKNAQNEAAKGTNPSRPDETILLDSPHQPIQKAGEKVNWDLYSLQQKAKNPEYMLVGNGTYGGFVYNGYLAMDAKYERMGFFDTKDGDFVFVSDSKQEIIGVYKIDKKKMSNGKLIIPMIYHRVEIVESGACFVCYRVENDKQVTMKIYSYNGDELSSIPKRVGEKEVLDMMGIYKDKNGMYHQKGN